MLFRYIRRLGDLLTADFDRQGISNNRIAVAGLLPDARC